MSYKPPTTTVRKKTPEQDDPLITRQAFEKRAASKTVTGYVLPSKRPAETPGSFDDAFPELAAPAPQSTTLKPTSVWATGKSFTEKLKDASSKAEVNTILPLPANPHYRVRVVDMPNPPGGEMDDDHPTIQFLEKIHSLRAARLERDRLKAIELKKLHDEEWGETDSQEEPDDYDDSLSDLYPEPDDNEDDGNYVEED